MVKCEIVMAMYKVAVIICKAAVIMCRIAGIMCNDGYSNLRLLWQCVRLIR